MTQAIVYIPYAKSKILFTKSRFTTAITTVFTPADTHVFIFVLTIVNTLI